MKLPSEKSVVSVDIQKYIYLIYGEPKCGKSTLASHFEDSMFICTEPGHKFLSVYGGDHIHTSWTDIRDTVKNLLTTKHDFKNVVIDIVDNAIELCSAYVLGKMEIEHESDAGFGKGWSAVQKEFKMVFGALANKGLGIIFISHTKVTDREKNGIKKPFMDNSMTKAGSKFICGLSDFIFYAYINDAGDRLLRTKATLNINAGDRSGTLPDTMPMDYKEIKKHLETYKNKNQKTNSKGK